ncbi:copper resistance protein CopC [Streptomyces sp. NPDC006172]|uniref:copper resistance CopC/CopD family protein n=1 Tax=Streptomyces sp. NPDC006172 TaxID=3154470 RepID=UPI0033DC5834
MLLGALLFLLVLGGAGPASAHAALRSTDPADGSVLKSSPGSITLTFTESISLLDDSFRVLDPDNQRVDTGEARHADGRSETAQVPLTEKLGTGTFTVAWRVVSADSHPVSGAFTFSVGQPSPTTAVLSAGPAEDPATGGLFKIGRYLAYGAATLVIGIAVFVAACRPPDVRPLRKPLLAGFWVLVGTSVYLLLLRAPYEEGTGPAAAFDLAGLQRTLTGRPGFALLARLALLAATAVLLLRLRRLRRQGDREQPTRAYLAAGAVLAVGLALTWAAAEHASAGIQVPAAMTSSTLHLLAMAAWLGGLASLLTLLHRTDLPAVVAARFSRVATASVIVLAATGVYQSWRGLGTLDTLTTTTYGRVLLAKLAAVALLLLAGAWSRHWTKRWTATEPEATAEVTSGARPEATSEAVRETEPSPVAVGANMTAKPLAATDGTRRPVTEPATEPVTGRDAEPVTEPASTPTRVLSPPEDAHRRALRRSVLVEVAVSVVVLLLTTILTATLPGRAAAEAAASERSAGLPVASVIDVPFAVGSARGRIQVTLDPARVGGNSVQAVAYALDGGLVPLPELRMTFTLPSQDIGPLDAKLTDRGGYWSTPSVDLPLPGTWEMKLTVRVSEIDQVSVTRPVRIER